MNNRKDRAKFKNFRILLDTGCSYRILMGRLVQRLGPKKYDVMQWHTQAGKITTNIKTEVNVTLPKLIKTNAMTWKCYINDSAKARCEIIIVRCIWTELGVNLKWSDRAIEAYYGTFKGSTAPMVDLGAY